MIGWLWRVIVGRFQMPPLCQHRWMEVRRFDKIGSTSRMVKAVIIELRCTKCGEVTHRHIKVNP